MVSAARGALIALEGIDGAGTTTQARLLVEWLVRHGLPAHLTCEPSSGPVGQLLRTVLRGEAPWPMDPAAVALLFAADRVDHYQHEILPRLRAGVHVVSDRYVYSSLAYQSLDQDPAWVESINGQAPEPALTIYVRVPPDLAKRRRESRGGSPELYDASSLQERISAQYDLILGSSPEAGSWVADPTGSDWIRGSTAVDPALPRGPLTRRPVTAVVDGSLPLATLHERLCKLCEKVARASRT